MFQNRHVCFSVNLLFVRNGTQMWLRLFIDVHLQKMCILQRFLYVCSLRETL